MGSKVEGLKDFRDQGDDTRKKGRARAARDRRQQEEQSEREWAQQTLPISAESSSYMRRQPAACLTNPFPRGTLTKRSAWWPVQWKKTPRCSDHAAPGNEVGFLGLGRGSLSCPSLFWEPWEERTLKGFRIHVP